MTKSLRFIALLAPLTLQLAGCSSLFASLSRDDDPASSAQPAHATHFAGSEYCERDPRARPEIEADAALDQNVRNLMCSPRPVGEYFRRGLERIPEAERTPEVIALAVVSCVGQGWCGPTRPGLTSEMALLSRSLDQTAVEARVSAVDAPEEIRSAFMERLRASQAVIEEAVAELDPEDRERVFEPMAERFATWEASRRSLAPLRDRADELLSRARGALDGGGATAELLEDARSLRDEYVAACAALRESQAICVGGPVARPLTELAVRLALALDDVPAAARENAILTRFADLSELRYQLHRAVSRAGGRAENVGHPPPRGDLAAEVDAAMNGHEAIAPVVRRARRRGDRMRLEFEPAITRRREGIPPCRTVWIDRDGDGTPEREAHCSRFRTVERRFQEEPVFVPVADAEGVTAGMKLTLVFDEQRAGRVVRVYPSSDATRPTRVAHIELEAAGGGE